MAEVNVTIADRSFLLACDDGQEPRLQSLADNLADRVAAVRNQNSGVGDTHAIVLAALAVLDEFDESKKRWANNTPEGEAAEWAADRLDAMSERLEKVLAAVVGG